MDLGVFFLGSFQVILAKPTPFSSCQEQKKGLLFFELKRGQLTLKYNKVTETQNVTELTPPQTRWSDRSRATTSNWAFLGGIGAEGSLWLLFIPIPLPPLGFVPSRGSFCGIIQCFGAFVYSAFPGCFQLCLFGAFPVNFWGQVLVSLRLPGRASLPGIKHCNFPNFFF